MISIKRIDVDDFNNLITYDLIDIRLENELNSSNNLYFAIIDGNKVLGHALITLFPNILIAEIIEIYIIPRERNQGLGDGVLRTVLNYLHINLYANAIVKGYNEIESFLINTKAEKIDLTNMPEQIKSVLKKSNESQYYIYNIKEFFSGKCKGSKL